MSVSSLNQALLKVGILGPAVSTAPQNLSTVSPLGEVRVENPASQLFQDTFSTATLDTINRWASTTGGTGSSVTPSVGAVVLTSGTVANSFAKLTSSLATGQGTFLPSEPGFLLFNARCNLQFPTSTTALINFGLGTSPATPTIASPITQFIGFEVTLAGKLQAVVYQTGTRVLIQDLSVTPPNTPPGTPAPQPVDANAHKYFIYFRGDIAYWCIDDKDNVVAQYQTGASGPDVNNLPILFQTISNGSPGATLQINAVSLGDTSHTGTSSILFNGFTNELQRSNTDSNTALITLTAQGSGTVNSADQINVNGKGLVIGTNLTVLTAGSLTINIQGKDVVSGQYYTIASSAAIAATGFNNLVVYPGVTPITATNTVGSFSAVLPRTWRVQAVVATGPATATIGASVIN
jgi:hypothetical protein